MSSLIQVIFYSLIGGVILLVGGFMLISNKNRAKTLAEYATPFAAGALLSAAFIDLLQEAGHAGNIDIALTFALVGILVFFLLERFLHWFHHHHEHQDKKTDPKIPLIIAGDTIHNFIDGIAIAAGFLVGPSTGIVVTLAVAAHEIPQEIGDFGLLLKKGLSRKKVIIVNIMSALATTLAAIIFFQLGQEVEVPLDAVLGLVAGFFIYIAVSDIIPMIHKKEGKAIAGPHTALLLAGVLVVGLVTTALHQYIETDESHDHGAEISIERSKANDMHETYEYADHETVPSVEVEMKKDQKSGWNIHLETANFTFSPKEVGGENEPGHGHVHIYINGEKWGRIYSPDFYLAELKDGDELKVALSTNDHKTYTHDGEEIATTIIVGSEHSSDGDHHDMKDENGHNHEH